MSLKQEFIDMVRLITEPLEAGKKYGCFSLEVDPLVDVCELDGSDVTYTECYDCENQHNCTARKQVEVDVSFTDFGFCDRLYVFNKKPPIDKGIRSIWNRKQLMKEIFDLKKEVESFKDYYATFGSRYTELLQYAKEFAEELKRDFTFFIPLNENVLPIVFHLDYIKNEKSEECYKLDGNFISFGTQSAVNILYYDDIERTQFTIRHEILHYALYVCGMKHFDNEAIFHFLCEKYEAGAYMEMSEAEQVLYDDLEKALSKFEDVFENDIVPVIQADKDVSEVKRLYISNMVYSVGSKEKNECYIDASVHENTVSMGKQLIQMFVESK